MTFQVIAQAAAGIAIHLVDAVELPIRCSADSVALISLSAFAGDNTPVHTMSAADPQLTPLARVLAELTTEVHLLLRSAEPELVDALGVALAGIDPERVQIVSAEPALLLGIATQLPDVLRGLLVRTAGIDEPLPMFAHRVVSLARLARADLLHLGAALCQPAVLRAVDQWSLDVQVRDAEQIDLVRELYGRGLRRFSAVDVRPLLELRRQRPSPRSRRGG